MQLPVQIKSKNLSHDRSSATYLEKRLEPIGRLLKDGSKVVCEAELAKTTDHHVKGEVYYAEVNLSIDGAMYRSTAEAETIEAAIDTMQAALIREVRRDKKKNLRFVRSGGAKVKEFLRGFGRGK